jgi:hypothetical protein
MPTNPEVPMNTGVNTLPVEVDRGIGQTVAGEVVESTDFRNPRTGELPGQIENPNPRTGELPRQVETDKETKETIERLAGQLRETGDPAGDSYSSGFVDSDTDSGYGSGSESEKPKPNKVKSVYASAKQEVKWGFRRLSNLSFKGGSYAAIGLGLLVALFSLAKLWPKPRR